MVKKPGSKWGRKAHALGLDRDLLAQLSGAAPQSISRGLNGRLKGGIPRHLISLILAWELMTDEQRAAWVAAMGIAGGDDEHDG